MTRELFAIDLHRHNTRHDGDSILLSRDGVRGNAHHIAKSKLQEPASHQIVKVGDEVSRKGLYRVEKWILDSYGWLTSRDEGQSSFNL